MKNILISMNILIIFIVITIIYTFTVTGISLIFFKDKANGSLIEVNGKFVGSELLAQKFTSDKYFWSRPSSVDYQTIPSGASNKGYTNKDLLKAIEERKNLLISKHNNTNIPKDLLFASASGIDPHLSREAIIYQFDRVANARNFNPNQKLKLLNLIDKSTEKRQFFIFGEERINVLKLNISLDKID